MDIPVLLEPTPTGWRASTGAPLNLVAEGPDKDALLATFREQIVRQYIAGVRIATLSIPECDPLLDIVKKMAAEPALEEWLKIMQDRRNDPDPLLARLAAFREEDRGFLEEWAQAVKQIREDSGIPDPDEELFPADPTPYCVHRP